MKDNEYFKNEWWALFTLFIRFIILAIIFLSIMWGISIGHFLRELWNTAIRPLERHYLHRKI